jgi:hypothetical protein
MSEEQALRIFLAALGIGGIKVLFDLIVKRGRAARTAERDKSIDQGGRPL